MPKIAATWLMRKRGTIWISFFLLWLALGMFSAGTFLIELPRMRRSAPPPGMLSPATRTFLWQLAIWIAWVALAPVALWLRRRFPLERGLLKIALPAHLLAVCLLCATHSGLILLMMWLIMHSGGALPEPRLDVLLTYWWVRDMPFCALFYGLILGIGSALDYYRQFRERELRASQLEAQLAQAQLQVLKMQLHPHFLFNTLNGITGLVRDHDNAAAVQMLVGLSDLLRQTLDNSGKQEVRLGEELEWLELYLKLQQIRFSDRLQVSVNAEPETLDALTPNLIMQPLVENAIRHGLAPRAAPGSVSLSAKRVNGRLELRVCDDGVGLPDGWRMASGKGVGLLNTEARLRQLYGADFAFEARNREQGGAEVLLSIPLRLASAIEYDEQREQQKDQSDHRG
ncbi:MAG TPA: histidine kinase [Blastocatellia bacterium]|nr:histidine kinase [Blastocatellia bacterium]